MTRAPSCGAPRQLAAVMLALAFPAGMARAEEVSLTLPLAAVLAIGAAAAGADAASAEKPFGLPAGRRAARRHGLLPSELHLPDAYAEEYDRDPRRWAAPVDSDRIVSLDLLRRPHRGWMASLAYDEESRGPLPGSGSVFGLSLEYDF